jgi:hypothetical protein
VKVKHELNNSKNAFVIMHGVNLPQYIDEVFANITMFRNTWGAQVLEFSEGRRGPLKNFYSVFFFNNNSSLASLTAPRRSRFSRDRSGDGAFPSEEAIEKRNPTMARGSDDR